MKKLSSTTYYIILLSFLSLFSSCQEVESLIKASPLPAPAGNYLDPGDIIVINYNSDSIVALDSEGTFKKTIFQATGNSITILALGWSAEQNKLLFTTDGIDRTMAIDAYTGDVSDFIVNVNVVGALRGVSELSNGNIAILESNNIEMFSPLGSNDYQRETTGFPITNLINTGQGMAPLTSGGFVIGARGSDVIRTYDEDGVQQASVAGPAGATDGYFAVELENGNIVGVWSGNPDRVIEYDSGLTATGNSYSNATYLVAPRGVAQLENGNIVVTEFTYNQLLELNASDFSLVRTFGQGLSGPTHVLVIPQY